MVDHPSIQPTFRLRHRGASYRCVESVGTTSAWSLHPWACRIASGVALHGTLATHPFGLTESTQYGSVNHEGKGRNRVWSTQRLQRKVRMGGGGFWGMRWWFIEIYLGENWEKGKVKLRLRKCESNYISYLNKKIWVWDFWFVCSNPNPAVDPKISLQAIRGPNERPWVSPVSFLFLPCFEFVSERCHHRPFARSGTISTFGSWKGNFDRQISHFDRQISHFDRQKRWCFWSGKMVWGLLTTIGFP